MYYPRSLELRLRRTSKLSVCVVHNLGREFGLQESFKSKVAWPNGKASDYESEDSGFDPQRDHLFLPFWSLLGAVRVSGHVRLS
ncbi:hypothetical protein QL093DRAFT_2271173 [Fusarium oxysporum]|nr:hypothetical protein QL093DRAFT_2271173 [Fusarium oxysporum]